MSSHAARKRLLVLALCATAAAAAAVSRDELLLGVDSASVAMSAGARPARVAADAVSPPRLVAPRPATSAEPADLFESRSWQPARPPEPAAERVAASQSAPAAPPLPFVYLGQYQDTARPIVFLVRGDRVLPVREGDVIEGLYRVDEVSGDSVGFTYLPLKIRQTLLMGNAG